MANTIKLLAGALTLTLLSDISTVALANAFNDQTGIDKARLPSCLSLPGTGNDLLKTSQLAATIIRSHLPQDCASVIKRSGFDI